MSQEKDKRAAARIAVAVEASDIPASVAITHAAGTLAAASTPAGKAGATEKAGALRATVGEIALAGSTALGVVLTLSGISEVWTFTGGALAGVLGGGGPVIPPAPWDGAIGAEGFYYTAAAPIPALPTEADTITLESPGFDASGAATTRTRVIPFLGYGRQFYPNGNVNVTTQAILGKRVFAGEVGGANVTNGSAKADRAPFIADLSPAHRWLTTATLSGEVFVDHWHGMDGKPVAAVRRCVKDSAGTVFKGPWVSTQIAKTSPATGLYVPCYSTSVTFMGAAAGRLTSYHEVAPNIGAAIYDQLAAFPTPEAHSGNLPQHHYYDPTDTLRRYVTLGGADDTPKGVGTTPGSAPAYLTVNGAATALDVAMVDLGLGGVILLPDGVTAAMTPGLNSLATTAFGIQIAGVGPLYNGVITAGGDSADYVFQRTIWSGLSIDGTGGGRVFANRATTAWAFFQTFYRVAFVNCPSGSLDYFQSCGRAYFWECTSDSPDGFTADVQGNTIRIAAYLSSQIGGNLTHHLVGCKVNAEHTFPNGTRAPIHAFNLSVVASGTNNVKCDGFLAGDDGFCIVGNLMVHTGSITDDCMELEGSAPCEFYNAILAHNTAVGADSNGSRSNQTNEETTAQKYHEMKVVACIFDGRVKDGDYDNVGAATTPGSRQRNHPVRWGVDEEHNVSYPRLSAAYGFDKFPGERLAPNSINPATRTVFANDRTAYGSNNATLAVPGDYRLIAASIPVNMPRPVGASLHHGFDLQGTPIPTNGTALPGAIQTAA